MRKGPDAVHDVIDQVPRARAVLQVFPQHSREEFHAREWIANLVGKLRDHLPIAAILCWRSA